MPLQSASGAVAVAITSDLKHTLRTSADSSPHDFSWSPIERAKCVQACVLQLLGDIYFAVREAMRTVV